MKIKKIAGLTLMASAVIAMASCGGTKTTDKFIVTVSARSYSTEMAMLHLWEKEYETLHPEVDIQVDGWGSVETSQAYVQRYALNRSALSNIIYTTDDTTALLAIKNNFVDLRSYYESDPETDYTKYYSTMLDTASYNGEFRPTTSYTGAYECEKDDSKEYGLYFAPREYNMPGIVLNTDLFKEYGIEIPSKADWNWDKMVELLQTISDMTAEKAASNAKYTQYRGMELNQTWEPVYTTFMKELGGDGLFTFDEDDEASSNVSSTANKEAYKKLISAFGNSKYRYALDRDYSNDNFEAGTIFMSVVSYPEVGNYAEKIDNIAFLPFPGEYVCAGCGGYGILTDKKDEVQKISTGETRKTVDLCWDFLKYTISKDGQNSAGKEGYIQPVLKELATTGDWLQSFDPELDHTAFCNGKELGLKTYTFATPDKRNNLRDDISTMFRKILETATTENDIDSILNTANNSINQHLKNN